MDPQGYFDFLVSFLRGAADSTTDTGSGRFFHIGPYRVFISWEDINREV